MSGTSEEDMESSRSESSHGESEGVLPPLRVSKRSSFSSGRMPSQCSPSNGSSARMASHVNPGCGLLGLWSLSR